MIKKSYDVHLKKDRSCILFCLGDVGYGGDRCDIKALESDLRYLTAKKKSGSLIRIIGLGDWCAFMSPTERAAMIGAKGGKGFYDATLAILDEAMKERCDGWLEIMKPFAGDFFGTVHGHHLFEFTGQGKGCEELRRVNSDQYICNQLKCDYYGDIGFIRLNFPELNAHQELTVHHGYGSGRTHGTAVCKRERVFEGFETDLVLMGHDNRRIANATNQIMHTGWREKRSVGTGAYERAYVDQKLHSGYVEELLLNPSAIGATMILFENFEGHLRVRAMV